MNLHDPSPYQATIWEGWYLRDLGPDPLGRWLGWCPVHTPRSARDPERPNAVLNFSVGSITCLAESGCFSPNRSTASLDRVTSMIARQYLQGSDPLPTSADDAPAIDFSPWPGMAG